MIQPVRKTLRAVPRRITFDAGRHRCTVHLGASFHTVARISATVQTLEKSLPAQPWLNSRRGYAADGIIEIKTPEFGAESITEGTVQEWQKKVGDYVAVGDILAVIETDKVSVEIKAENVGTLVELLVQVDDTCEVGQPLCTMKPGGTPPPKQEKKAEPVVEAKTPSAPAAKPATPAPTPTKAPETDGSTVAPTFNRAERRNKMSRMRRSIARSMKEAQNTACMLSTFQEVDMSAIINLRKEHKDEFEAAHGVKLGFMGAFVKASAFALRQLPAVNAVIDDTTQEVVYRDYCDVSVAVASPKGLVVPVIRNAQSLSINEVESSINELAMRARNDELGMEDMMGGTFTITNGGVFGSMLSTPILNSGFGNQSAIMGMHFTKQRPVVLKNGNIEARPIMYLALTYDHRLVDGREAVTFLCLVRDQIEDPRRLILGC